ncbi:MAG: response regulator transcription factor [Brumimicrobium sp.]
MIPTILIADDHELFRKSLIVTLKNYFPDTDFIEASNGEEVLEITKKNKPDIILLDIEMPVMNGIKTLLELRKNNLNSKVLMLSSKTAKEFIYISKEYKANGYFTKNVAPDMLAEVIMRIISSNLFICSEWFSLEFTNKNRFSSNTLTRINLLTKREREVLKYFFNGLNTSEVSEIMSVRKKSIDNYKNRILTKMETTPDMFFQDWVIKNREVIGYLI